MRRAWIIGCVLLLAACSKKVTVSAVDLSVEFKGYVPQCVRVTASDAEAPQEHTSSETLSRDKLVSTDPNDDRTVRIAVYREESWSQKLLIEVTSFKDKCDGIVVETRKLEPVTLPTKGTEARMLKLLAADGDNDGFFDEVVDSAIPVANDCNDKNDKVYPGAPTAVCDGTSNLGADFNCDKKSDCIGSVCTKDTDCGSGFCVDGVCCNNACNSPPTCRGTGVCNAAGSVGTCKYPVTPNVLCSDGNGCTLNDKCDANGVCVAGAAKTCNTAPGVCYGSTGTCKPLTGACEYPPLGNGTFCNDSNNCTSSDRCNNGVCAGTPKVCNAPPGQCHENTGTCNATSGNCEYSFLSNTTACNDNNKCTDADKCNGSGTCAGTAKVCNTAPGQCYSSNGTCNGSTGTCDYPGLSNTTSCNDGKDCTSPDKCDGLGSCISDMNCPPPNECKVASNSVCTETGVCVFEVNTSQVGKVCNEGGKKGTCSPQGTCLRFNYAVTPNFNPETLAENRTVIDVTVACAATLDTSGNTPTWSDSGCGFPKPTPVVLGSVVVVPIRNLVVDAQLRVVGTRPVIFAVYGNATLNDEIRAHSVPTQTGAGSGAGCSGRVGAIGAENGGDGSGGGGGGLATLGGNGGANDDGSRTGGGGGGTLAAGFSPLAGGCAGGDGGFTGGVAAAKGGPGGGSVQLSVAGTLVLRSVVSVSGAGGEGGEAAPGKTAGGGGGGSGGLLVLEADTLVVESTAKLTANGGAGGEGGSDSGGVRATGNAGPDGSVTGNSPASGGTGGSTGGGDGGAGAAGTANPGNGSKGASTGGNQAAGGGGGGAAGRILLRGVTSCSAISPDSVISPAYDKAGGQCAAPALR